MTAASECHPAWTAFERHAKLLRVFPGWRSPRIADMLRGRERCDARAASGGNTGAQE